MTKVCNTCGIEKETGQFSKNKKMRDGRLNKCKACESRYRATYRSANREKIKKQDRERYGKQKKESKEKRREYLRLWRQEKRVELREYQAMWREKNRERVRVYGMLSRVDIKSRCLPKELMGVMVANQTLKSLVKNRKEGVRHENEQRLLQDS